MELSSSQARSTTSNLHTRQLATPNLSAQATDTFISQLAGQLNQSSSLLQADGLTANDPSSPPSPSSSQSPSNPAAASPELREAFHDFVGQTFFGEMIKACRTGQQPSAYFNGGRAEEIFQGQLDQVMAEELSKSSADKIADPMFELFMLKRQS